MLRRAFSTQTAALAAAKKNVKVKAQSFGRKNQGTSKSTKKNANGALYQQFPLAASVLVHSKRGGSVAPAPAIAEGSPVATYTHPKELSHLGSFKLSQRLEMLQEPVALKRDVTESFINSLQPGNKYIITGDAGVGKSTVLSQIHDSSLSKGAVVIHISNPGEMVNGRSNFARFGDVYAQPSYTKRLLHKVLVANRASLSKIPLSEDVAVQVVAKNKQFSKLAAGTHTIADLLALNPVRVGEVWDIFIRSLLKSDAPVVFSVDNLSALIANNFTAYRNVENKSVYVTELQIVKTIVELIEKDSKVTFVAATCGDDRSNATLPTALGHVEHDPYASNYHYDANLAKTLSNLKEFRVPVLEKTEVAEILKVWKDSGLLLAKDAEKENLVDEKYFLSGGNAREVVKSCVLRHSV